MHPLSQPDSPLQLAARLTKAQTELDVLYTFGTAIHAPSDWLPLYRILYDQAERVMPIDAAYIAFLVENRTRFQTVISVDEGIEYPLDPPWEFSEDRPSGWVVYHAEPVRFMDFEREVQARFPAVYVGDIVTESDFGNTEKASHAWMTVPMLVNREVRGIINVQSYQYGVYREREERLLMTLGSMLAIAVSQSQFMQQLETMRQALSAPLIPVTPEIVILPLIGVLDAARREIVQRKLLSTVEHQRVRHVILDLTGLTDMRVEIQHFLLHLVNTAALLGASCTFSGIYPELARTFALAGGDLSKLQMVRSVEQGLIRFGAVPGSQRR